MAESGIRELIIENRHSGERLAMRRVKRGDEVWLELKGLLPPHRQGPPLHIHVAEDEEGVVRSGTLSAVLNDRRFTVGSGERVSLPRPIQAVLFRVIVTVGTLLGRYRGEGWPGCPSRCLGAPLDVEGATESAPAQSPENGSRIAIAEV